MSRDCLTADRLKELLSYDPETGVFTRRVSAGLRAPAGAVAGSPNDAGYILISVDYVKYRAHRLAWLYMTGRWPANEVDHRNGNRADNRWANLRDVTPTVNRQNQRRAMSNSKTGLLGVSWSERDKAFVARIKVGSKYQSLGQHQTAEAGHAAYLAAKRRVHEGCTI